MRCIGLDNRFHPLVLMLVLNAGVDGGGISGDDSRFRRRSRMAAITVSSARARAFISWEKIK